MAGPLSPSTRQLPPPRAWMKRNAAVAGLLVAGLLVALGIYGLFRAPAAGVAPASPPQSPLSPGFFRVSRLEWGGLGFAVVGAAEFAQEEGTEGEIALDDDVTVQVFPPFSGQVVRVLARAGDVVAKGEALATAQASELGQAQADLSSAVGNLSAARAQLVTAQANATRQQALLQISGAAVKDVQVAVSDLAAARASVRSDEAVLAAVRGRLAVLGYDAAGMAALASRAAGAPGSDLGGDLGGAPLGSGAVVRAPISGVVVSRNVGPGQYLNATANGATTALFTISDLSKVWLVANVREADADRMRVGLPVRVSVLGLPGRSFEARLNYVAAALDPTTRRLPVRAVVDNPDGLLKPAMFADFTIRSGPGETAPAVPAAAVIYEGDTARVWVAGPDHTLALHPIRTGRTRDGLVEALSGLKAGERVVTSGALFIDRAARSG